jgi:PKD repeat protein
LEGVATSANARRPYLEGVGKPAHGFAMIQGEIIAYVPPAGYTGSDTFEYTVHDPKAGRSATGKIVVTVEKPPPNRPPVASFTASPTTGPAPLKVDFDAGGSTDPDRDSLTYTWSFGDGSTSSPESNPTAEHTYEKDGRYTIVLTVTDGKSGSVTERKTVTVTKKK